MKPQEQTLINIYIYIKIVYKMKNRAEIIITIYKLHIGLDNINRIN